MTQAMQALRRPLTEAEKQQYCDQYYTWVQEILRNKYGREAEEYAGLAIWDAVNSFDGSCPLSAWVCKKALWTGKDELRKRNGRHGSRKREAMQSQSSLMTHDQSETAEVQDPAERVMQLEDTLETLKTFDLLDGRLKLILLGRFLGELHDEHIGNIIGYNRRQITGAIRSFRESLRIA